MTEPRPRMTARRELAGVVVVCAAAAGLVLFSATRVWLTQTTPRPEPLGPLVESRTGASLMPALSAMALVMLAGAGAILASRGLARRVVGVLIALAGLTAPVLALASATRPGISMAWLLATALGGLVGAAAGVATTVRGRGWPAMGSRYERTTTPRTPEQGAGTDSTRLWDALDRGEDPTER